MYFLSTAKYTAISWPAHLLIAFRAPRIYLEIIKDTIVIKCYEYKGEVVYHYYEGTRKEQTVEGKQSRDVMYEANSQSTDSAASPD